MELTHPNFPNLIGFSSSVTVQIWFPPGQVSSSICAAHFFCTPCILLSKLHLCFVFPFNWSTSLSPNCTARSRRENLAAECHRCSQVSDDQKGAKSCKLLQSSGVVVSPGCLFGITLSEVYSREMRFTFIMVGVRFLSLCRETYCDFLIFGAEEKKRFLSLFREYCDFFIFDKNQRRIKVFYWDKWRVRVEAKCWGKKIDSLK